MIDLYVIARFTTMDGYDEESELIKRNMTTTEAKDYVAQHNHELCPGWFYWMYPSVSGQQIRSES